MAEDPWRERHFCVSPFPQEGATAMPAQDPCHPSPHNHCAQVPNSSYSTYTHASDTDSAATPQVPMPRTPEQELYTKRTSIPDSWSHWGSCMETMVPFPTQSWNHWTPTQPVTSHSLVGEALSLPKPVHGLERWLLNQMCRHQCKDQGKMTPPKEQNNFPITISKERNTYG